ncbi:hypothetical protein PybrP1_009540 [[Pythium] brassicae (nom. inval.)]|nr:hypothetical protein PybrP1_009540 [[Pythium] brassicae (nom. inval.)]
MNLIARCLLLTFVCAAALPSFASSAQPRSLAERRTEMRQRILQAQAAKQAAFEQREKDFFSGKRRNREVLLERVLFAVLLGVSLLLVSIAMLRSDMAAPTASTHTFRDGFIVADRVERRTETATPADAALGADATATDNKKSSAPMLRKETAPDASKAPAAAAAAAIHVSGADAHTTTIKMEGGDEITIKRAASSKNKITTISTHEDGKITIENRDGATAEDATALLTPVPSKQAGGVGMTATDSPPVPHLATPEPAKTRSVDFVGAYEDARDARAVAADATDADPRAAGDSADMGDVGDVGENGGDAPTAAVADAGDSTHEIVVGKKKVTIVNVGRSETTVSLLDVEDEAVTGATEEVDAAKKLSSSSR